MSADANRTTGRRLLVLLPTAIATVMLWGAMPAVAATPLPPAPSPTADNPFGATLFVNLPPPLPTLNFIGSVVVKVLLDGTDSVGLQVLNSPMEP